MHRLSFTFHKCPCTVTVILPFFSRVVIPRKCLTAYFSHSLKMTNFFRLSWKCPIKTGISWEWLNFQAFPENDWIPYLTVTYTHTYTSLFLSFFFFFFFLLCLIFIIQITSNPEKADTPPGRRTATPWITTSTPPTSGLPAASRLHHHHPPTYLRRHPHWQSTWTLNCDKLDPKGLFYQVVNLIFIPWSCISGWFSSGPLRPAEEGTARSSRVGDKTGRRAGKGQWGGWRRKWTIWADSRCCLLFVGCLALPATC